MGFQSKSNIDSSGVSKGERSRWRVDLPDVRDMCDSVFELILLLLHNYVPDNNMKV